MMKSSPHIYPNTTQLEEDQWDFLEKPNNQKLEISDEINTIIVADKPAPIESLNPSINEMSSSEAIILSSIQMN